MPQSRLAFGGRPSKKLGDHPPVERSRELTASLYFTDKCWVISVQMEKNARGADIPHEVKSEAIDCHITRVQNQRGAFTQGSAQMAGSGPLTSASAWFLHVPLGAPAKVGDVIENSHGERYSLMSVDDDASWRIFDSYRVAQLGINQEPIE